MDFSKVMEELEAAGTAQNRKIYARHGAKGALFGVSFSALGKLQRKIKRDQALADQLWASGNVDAMTLATMVADPVSFGKRDLDRWVRDVDYSVTANLVAKHLAAPSSHAQWAAAKWIKSKLEFVAVSGWNVVACLAMAENEIPERGFSSWLKTIENEIGEGGDEVRHAMNSALIAIGIRNKSLRKKAVATSRRIGVVEVDHGETGCKTPPAEPYIERAWARKEKT